MLDKQLVQDFRDDVFGNRQFLKVAQENTEYSLNRFYSCIDWLDTSVVGINSRFPEIASNGLSTNLDKSAALVEVLTHTSNLLDSVKGVYKELNILTNGKYPYPYKNTNSIFEKLYLMIVFFNN